MYANTDDLYSEILDLEKANPEQVIRIGTGELSDSLALEDITGICSELVPFILQRKNIILELKTKTNQVRGLHEYKPQGKVVVAWSVNPESIVETEEIHSNSLLERLNAARQCQEWGYRIAFHFDPIIHIPDWDEQYKELVDTIFSRVSPDHLAWISLGTFRFFPTLEEVIKARFPHTAIVYGEHFPTADGKKRYFRLLREKMYRTVVERIRMYAPKVPAYLCMESAQVWRNVFGWSPGCRDPWAGYYDAGLYNERECPIQAGKSTHKKHV